MEKKPLLQMLGLERKVADAAYIKEHLCPLSKKTGMDALVLALAYWHLLGKTNADLSYRYGLRDNTLTQISDGVVLQRNYGKYMWVLVRALNDLRLKAIARNDAATVMTVDKALMEVALLQAGVAIDSEMVEDDRMERDERLGEKLRREGVIPR